MAQTGIAFIGAGNMGGSLIAGLIASGYPAHLICACDASAERLKWLQDNYAIRITEDNATVIQGADVVVLAVKPQNLQAVAREIAPALKQRMPLIISIVAGIGLQKMQTWLGASLPIIRTMPNTPALIGLGATGLFGNSAVTAEQKKLAETMLQAVGITEWVADEEALDTVTAVSGSGPAYFFLFMEALQNAGVKLGLQKDTARLLSIQTALGAAQMALNSELSLTELRQQVTSAGGTTEKAIQVLNDNKLSDILAQAVTAAKVRAKELDELA